MTPYDAAVQTDLAGPARQPRPCGGRVFAILVSVSLIVWMMGSYDTLVREFDNDAEAYMGSYDLCLVPEAPRGPLPPGQYPRFSDPELPPAWPPLPWLNP